jgi:type VI secretion system protein ImpG
MSEPVEELYDRELAFLGEAAHDFARRYPAEAGRLVPDPDRPADPHLERFIEGFALLGGRIHHKLDTDFPELTETLLHVLYPHFLTPVPSLSIAQFTLDPQAPRLEDGLHIPKHAQLRTRPLGKPPMPCRWRTGYPVTLWPVQLTGAQVLRSYFPTGYSVPPRTVAALVLQLECQGPWRWSNLNLDRLRYYLSGDRQIIANLYEVLFNHTLRVAFRNLDPGGSREIITLPPEQCLGQVGFEPDEAILPWPRESFPGYRLLTEFLSFREKFLFLDIAGWRQVAQAGFGKKVEVAFFLNRAEVNLEQGVTARTFLAGCTPIINVFEKSAEPLAVTHRATEYRVVPARAHPMGMEVLSVDEVASFEPSRGHVDFRPFYAREFGADGRDEGHAFWLTSRRESYVEDDRGTEVYLTLVDSGFDPRRAADAVLHVKTTCSNRDWAVRFVRGGEALSFEPGEGPLVRDPALPAPAGLQNIACLHLPTPTLRPPLRRGTYWRLVAQNNLNHVSLTDPVEGRLALQEMLRLCDFSDATAPQLAAVNQQIIEGITALRCRPARARVTGGAQIGYGLGLETTVELDERSYVGVGVLLLASVLERFLALHAGFNSFSQLVAKTKQAEGYFKKWPPRAADRQLQ